MVLCNGLPASTWLKKTLYVEFEKKFFSNLAHGHGRGRAWELLKTSHGVLLDYIFP